MRRSSRQSTIEAGQTNCPYESDLRSVDYREIHRLYPEVSHCQEHAAQTKGLCRRRDQPMPTGSDKPGTMWPDNRALLNIFLDHMTW